MKLELVSLTGLKFSDDVYEVTMPTASGEISVFPDHMPLVSIAVPGVLTVKKFKEAQPETFATLGGVVEIDGQTVRLLADEVEHADELIESDVKKAYEDAQKLRSAAKTQVDIDKAQAMVDRQAIRLQVAQLRKRR